jgi:hypothetical protein
MNLIKKRQIGADLQNHEKQLFIVNWLIVICGFGAFVLMTYVHPMGNVD